MTKSTGGGGGRSRRAAATSFSTGRDRPPVIVQIGGGLLALLIAMIVYLVVISNQVSSDRERLGQVSGEIVSAEQKTAALKPYDDFAKAAAVRHDAVASVAKARFKWDRTLTEIAKVAPDNVWLTTMDGTLAPAAGAAAGTATGELTPSIKLAGCAAHERNVPAYIDRLHLMTGVTEVGFSRAEKLDKKGEAGTAGAAVDCFNNDTKAAKFELTTFFKTQRAPGATATPAATTTTPTAPAPAAGTTPATAPANQTAAVPTGGTR